MREDCERYVQTPGAKPARFQVARLSCEPHPRNAGSKNSAEKTKIRHPNGVARNRRADNSRNRGDGKSTGIKSSHMGTARRLAFSDRDEPTQEVAGSAGCR